MTLINTELNKKAESAQVALNSSENNVETLNETIAIVEESKIQETVTLNADESDEILKTLENETQVEIDYEQYVIESYEKELKETKDEFQIQDDKDGAINEIWNGVKEIFNFGVSKSDVKSAIEKQEITLEKLKQAKIDGNFSEVYEEITGQKYDEQKIIQCHQIETELDKILNSDNPQDFEEEYLILSNQYKEMSNEYLSTSNELTNVLNNYADSQNNFIDKTAQVAQIGGMGMMIVGGVACFIPGGQVIGAGMMKFGQMLALGGTFGDNALEAVDLMTNDKGFKEESDEFKELGKETLVDGALFVAGYASGTIAGKAGEAVLKQTGSNILSQVTDKGLDVAMSLASDTAITGEVDLAGEGMSQFLGVLTGSATARTYGAKINTKLDAFINDKLKLGIGKAEVEIPKVKNEEVETPKSDINDIDTKISNLEMLSVKNLNNDKQITKYDSSNKNIKIETLDVSADKNVLLDNEFSQDKLNDLYRSFGLPFGKENFNKNNDCKNQYIKTDVMFDDMVTTKTLYEYDESGNLIKKLQIKDSSIFGGNTRFSQGETGDCALLSMVVGFLNNSQTRQQFLNAIVESVNGKYEVKVGSQVVEVAKNELSNKDLSNLKSIRILELAYQKVGGSLDGEFAENVAELFGLKPIHITFDKITDELLETISKDSNNFVLSLGVRIDAEGIVNQNGECLHYFSIKEINPEAKKVTLIDTYDTSQTFEMSFDEIKTQGVSIDGGSVIKTDLPNVERSADEIEFRGRNNGIKAPKEADKQHVIAKNSSGNWEFDINTRGELTGTHTDEAINYLFSLSMGASVPGLNGRNGTITYKSPSGDEIRIGRGSTTTIIKKSTINGKTIYERGYCLNGGNLNSVRYGNMSHSPEQACNEILDNLDKIKYIKTTQNSKYFMTKDINGTMHYWEFKGDDKKINTLYEVQGLGKGIKNTCANIDGYTPFVHSFSW